MKDEVLISIRVSTERQWNLLTLNSIKVNCEPMYDYNDQFAACSSKALTSSTGHPLVDRLLPSPRLRN